MRKNVLEHRERASNLPTFKSLRNSMDSEKEERGPRGIDKLRDANNPILGVETKKRLEE